MCPRSKEKPWTYLTITSSSTSPSLTAMWPCSHGSIGNRAATGRRCSFPPRPPPCTTSCWLQCSLSPCHGSSTCPTFRLRAQLHDPVLAPGRSAPTHCDGNAWLSLSRCLSFSHTYPAADSAFRHTTEISIHMTLSASGSTLSNNLLSTLVL